MADPTKVRNQPALTRGPGNTWLLVGGLMTLISAVILAFALNLQPSGVALVGLVAVAALFICMVFARLTIVPGQARLWALAVLLLTLALVSLVCLGIIAWSQMASL
ncbi:hypothetical protein [Glaciibacter sp. 2TAF33]|uniref:hypothetical protein n=1 Tax=Glaciibacter sp. 2TAF33 TaxID=3233015 RepID=UPI003F92FAE6